MDDRENAESIRTKLEQYQSAHDPKLKNTMSVLVLVSCPLVVAGERAASN